MVESGLVNGKDSDSISGTSSRLDYSSNRRGSMKEMFSRMQSKRASPSTVVLCVKDPLVVRSSCRADSLLSPN